ncbi:MAG: endolytic transglycosylase MltG, partial [Ktedonobacterales bacterium]|nr:endolytic transglycosylase MltG [Ktedonobacterales bacterium]
IIRSALVFKLYLKIRGKTLNAQQGNYYLSPSMHLQDIVTVLNSAPSTAYVAIQVVPGSRLLEYPGQILATAVLHDNGHPDDGIKGQKALPNFSATDFLSLTKTGNVDGLSDFWYVKKWDTSKGALTALEGYLIPETYYVDPTADATAIIKTMIKQFGSYLCPGPDDAHMFAYIGDQATCMAHQITITIPASITKLGTVTNAGQKMGLFDALKKYYGNNTPAELQQALTIASLAQREARTTEHFFMVDGVYYNRITRPQAETVGYLQADPGFQYFFGTQKAPWPTVTDVLGPGKLPGTTTQGGGYNLYQSKGTPPSAISGPGKDALYGAIFPPAMNYLYFFFACDLQTNLYSTTLDQQNQNEGQHSC